MTHAYIKPNLICTFKLFLQDRKGNYITWPKDIADYPEGSYTCTLTNKGYAIEVENRHGNTCRDAVIGAFGAVMCYCVAPLDSFVTLDPPKGKRGTNLISPAASIQLRLGPIGGWRSGSQGKEVLSLKKGLRLLATSATAQRKVFKLMDAFVGPIAMLAAGPKAYMRTSRPHPVYTVKDPAYTAKGVPKNTTAPRTTLKYEGVSNFSLRHPGLMSLVVGMSRFAVEVWLDGLYKDVDAAIDLNKVCKRLVVLRQRKSLSKADRKWLLGVIRTVKSGFLSSSKVKANPGAYPVNVYTWGLLGRFLEQEFDKVSLDYHWRSRKRGAYARRISGFFDWCTTEENAPKTFTNRPKDHNWSGNGELEFTT